MPMPGGPPISRAGRGSSSWIFQSPGTYYIIADGLNGAVGSTTVTINVSGPEAG